MTSHTIGDGSELSLEQRYAFEQYKKGENVFISGPGGSGKSHLIRYIVNDLFERGRIHAVTSTTGCSAILLSAHIRVCGKPIVTKTIHSWSGVRLCQGKLNEIVSMVFKNRRNVKEWKRCQTLIIDEISMLSKKMFDVLEYLARYIRGNDKPFGGMQLICLGDFFQLPPVGSPSDPGSMAFAFESEGWSRVFALENHVELVRVFRQSDDVFKRILSEVRRAEMSPETVETLNSRVGLEYRPEDHHGVRPMKLFPTRAMVNGENVRQYERLTGDEQTYHASVYTDMRMYVENTEFFEPDVKERCDFLSNKDLDMESEKMLRDLPTESLLTLKVGAPVMCLVNLDIDSGVANGSMGIVVDFKMMEFKCEFTLMVRTRTLMAPIVKFYNDVQVTIMPYFWQNTEFPVIAVSQIPLTLAYASSIHKMQGSTLDVAEMDLGGAVFAEHQTYVGLSRVRSLDGLYLKSFYPHKVRVNPQVVAFYATFANDPVEEVEEVDELEEDNVVLKMDGSHTNVGEGDGEVGGEGVEREDETPNGLCPVGVRRNAEAATLELQRSLMNGCAICLEGVFDRPCTTTCGHQYCYECIMRLLNCTLSRCAPCPMCRAPVTAASLSMVNVPKKKKR